MLDTDEGAGRLGEVVLVPHSSPISKSGLMFFNTLFDENAACHIAIGQCYAKCFVDGDKLTSEEIAARGGNKSMIHIDWMIGSARSTSTGSTSTATARRCSAKANGLEACTFEAHDAYWAMPLPNDQFSFLTSTRLMKTSSGRRPTVADNPSAMDL